MIPLTFHFIVLCCFQILFLQKIYEKNIFFEPVLTILVLLTANDVSIRINKIYTHEFPLKHMHLPAPLN